MHFDYRVRTATRMGLDSVCLWTLRSRICSRSAILHAPEQIAILPMERSLSFLNPHRAGSRPDPSSREFWIFRNLVGDWHNYCRLASVCDPAVLNRAAPRMEVGG